MDNEIGTLLKQTRKSHGITLKDLSARSGLSISYLSMLERGLSSPTIANLNKICRAFNITLSGLVLTLDQDKILVKKDERRRIYDDAEVLYEAATEGNRQMRGVCMTVRDTDEHLSEKHVSDEVGFVVRGAMEMTIGGVVSHLEAGDTLYIPANTAHSFRKTSGEDCVSFWVYASNGLEMPESYPIHLPKEEKKEP